MDLFEKLMSNQFLFYSILALISIGVIIVFTLLYMKRRNLKLFEQEEKMLLEHQEEQVRVPEEEIKVERIVTPTSTSSEENRGKSNLEEVLEHMQADLEKKEDVVAIFEQEQEEKAIISYQELLKSKNKNNQGTNQELLSVIEQIENGRQAKTIQEPVYTYDDVMEEPQKEKKDKKFKNTDFISPVYGKVDNPTKYPTIPNFKKSEKKNTRVARNQVEVLKNVEQPELEEEEVRNDAFLNALKKFRNNL